ncbi:MAG: hypothetical protein JKX73_03640 [Flavobacteriales bacterium]|nr:hypothetical protein [Flavobacteriales bacterium]
MKNIFFLIAALSTINANAQWVDKLLANGSQLECITFANDTVGYAGGHNQIMKTSNGGDTWSQTSLGLLGTLSWFTAIHFFDEDNGIAAGWYFSNDGELIIKTNNGGLSWTTVHQYSSFSGRWLYGLHFPTTLIGYSVGKRGRILKTTNGGTTWNLTASGTIEDLKSVHFTHEDTGYVVGDNIILKTTNGGGSWSASSSSARLNSVDFGSSSTGYAVGAVWPGDGVCLKTINAGATWDTLNTFTGGDLKSVVAIDADTIYTVAGSTVF